jgi:hypothetical protein
MNEAVDSKEIIDKPPIPLLLRSEKLHLWRRQSSYVKDPALMQGCLVFNAYYDATFKMGIWFLNKAVSTIPFISLLKKKPKAAFYYTIFSINISALLADSEPSLPFVLYHSSKWTSSILTRMGQLAG